MKRRPPENWISNLINKDRGKDTEFSDVHFVYDDTVGKRDISNILATSQKT